MANRIEGNVYIVDSAMGNQGLKGVGSSGWLENSKINAISFWSSDTTGRVIFTGTTTTNSIVVLTNPNDDPTTVGCFLGGITFSDMKCPTLTAGTAWIYLA